MTYCHTGPAIRGGVIFYFNVLCLLQHSIPAFPHIAYGFFCPKFDTFLLPDCFSSSVILAAYPDGSAYESNLWAAGEPGGYRGDRDGFAVTFDQNFCVVVHRVGEYSGCTGGLFGRYCRVVNQFAGGALFLTASR